MSEQLKSAEVNELVYVWFKKLDVHAPLEEIRPLLISEGLEMQFPNRELINNFQQFKKWYEEVTIKYFDEMHTMKMLDIDLNGDEATVKLVVKWEARRWKPPAAKSEWLAFDAWQTWLIKRDPKTGKAVICRYIVDNLDKLECSGEL